MKRGWRDRRRAAPDLAQRAAAQGMIGAYDLAAMSWDKATHDRVAHVYHHLAMPCAFLDSNRHCTVYRDRPLACRTHFVLSDPSTCSSREPDPDHITLDKGTRASSQAWLMQELQRVGAPIEIGTLPQQIVIAAWRTGLLDGEAKPRGTDGVLRVDVNR